MGIVVCGADRLTTNRIECVGNLSFLCDKVIIHFVKYMSVDVLKIMLTHV